MIFFIGLNNSIVDIFNKIAFFLKSGRNDNYFSLATSPPILIKLCSFDVFLYETEECDRRKKCRSAPQSEILIVKVDYFLGKKPVISTKCSFFFFFFFFSFNGVIFFAESIQPKIIWKSKLQNRKMEYKLNLLNAMHKNRLLSKIYKDDVT